MTKKDKRILTILAFIAMACGQGGCSTVEGVGSLMRGIGRDIEDTAQGTREKMYEKGHHN